jgi:hypothetical protein
LKSGTPTEANCRVFGYKSKHEKYLEAELARMRDEYRVLLSALLERAVSREAALMLRKPEELNLSIDNMKKRAEVVYEAQRKAASKPDEPPADPRHWRDMRSQAEQASRKAAQQTNSNDSVTRLEAKLPGGAH